MIWLLTTPCAHWHDFIADALDVGRHVTLRNPHRPDQILDQAAADKIRDYRAPAPGSFAIGRWRFCLRACLLRGAFIASFGLLLRGQAGAILQAPRGMRLLRGREGAGHGHVENRVSVYFGECPRTRGHEPTKKTTNLRVIAAGVRLFHGPRL